MSVLCVGSWKGMHTMLRPIRPSTLPDGLCGLVHKTNAAAAIAQRHKDTLAEF